MRKTYGLLSKLLVILLAGSFGVRADVVTDWNAIAVSTAVANLQTPFAQARYAAIVQLAVFEATNSITHEYRPYLGTLTAAKGASAEAAAVEAAYVVLSTYFPASLPDLLIDRTNSLATIPDGQSKTDGLAVGLAAANAMIALRANDGSSPGTFYTPGPAVPGAWQATASCPIVNGVASGVAFQWGSVTPFGITSAADFLLPPPPALPGNLYAKAYYEVKKIGSVDSTSRPTDRANVALFYAAATPTEVFNQAAVQVALEQGRSPMQNARDLALINMAISDSIVAAFFNKYTYIFWRPETAIHAGDTDGNPKTQGDPNWAPFVTTPCFPSYPSNHGSAANGAAAVMQRLYGEGGHSITLTNSAVPTIILHYTSFSQITHDISDARVYGGIHYRTDQEAGADLGQAVGKEVYRRNLRPVRER